MRIKTRSLALVFVALAFSFSASVVKAQSAHAEHLDLYAVADLFRDSDSIEKFERDLNDASKGVNNLDLNNDGQVDFIRVVEQMKDETRLIVLQTPTGENEFQDVATIIVEREGGNYNLQVQGDEEIYGANYYVVPAERNSSAWKVVRWLFSPSYRVYVSPYRYRHYPTWFAARRPVAVSAYRTRVGAFAGRRNFVAARAATVRTVNKITYRPARSNVVFGKRITTTTTTATNPRNGNQRTRTTTTVKRRKN